MSGLNLAVTTKEEQDRVPLIWSLQVWHIKKGWPCRWSLNWWPGSSLNI